MIIIGIDSGPVTSGMVFYDTILRRVTLANPEAVNYLLQSGIRNGGADICVCEDVVFYGVDVFPGKTTFDTCKQIGRFWQAWGNDNTFHFVNRREIKQALCGNAKAKDPQINQAIMDRFGGKGAKGTKTKPGPLYGVSGHAWSALAVVLTHLDSQEPHHKRLSDAKLKELAEVVRKA